ncbi:hypothetical protein BH683_021940 [Williamsia sp. 1138]|uniref:GOLPH3/VPS74 family protein n=1 Tax=Williamsia sp. 1138 TaxID=1903117 RepID=UPI000A107D8B|nr:GPP34 family phosphoprotein [Williamsia sp. 1138]OZG27086.1 hypothetical protein BH683_021940 [Williamsia sp. 1138]
MSTLIAEDLLLLLLDDDKGTTPASVPVPTVLGGAILMELALIDAIGIGKKPSRWTAAKVRVARAEAATDPVLRRAVGIVAEKERPAQSLLGRLGKGLKDELGTRLAKMSFVERRSERILGAFPHTTWPAVNRSHKLDLRRDVTAVLVHGNPPDDRTGGLIALLSSINRAHMAVDTDEVPRRELKKRAKAIAEGDWAAKAVADAIAAATAAITAATVASVAASSGS